MLGLFVQPIVEVIKAFTKHGRAERRYRKSARAAVRLHWLLSRLIEHSESFIEGLELVKQEQRVPMRIQAALRALQDDVRELGEMLSEDRFGMYTGFWRV